MGAPLTGLKRLLGPTGRRCSHAGFLTEKDPRWSCHNIVEIVSAGADDDFLGIGSTPWVGDYAGTALTVPAAPSPTQQDRYLFRLAAIEIPGGASVVVHGLRMAVELVADMPREAGGTVPLYRDQVSPFWHFTDGNVSWHLRHHSSVFRRRVDPVQPVGASPSLKGTQPARLYQLGGPNFSPGVPGVDVEGLGTMRDLRYPWGNTDWSLAVPVGGPGIVALYCSVRQTNPDTRPPTPFITPNTSLRPEDVFILETRQQTTEIARYGRVAGALLVEMFPSCRAPGEL